MKLLKITISSILLVSINSFADNSNTNQVKPFDLKNVIMGKNSFMAVGKMKINSTNGLDDISIPLVVTSKTLEIKNDDANNTLVEGEVTLSLRPRKGPQIDTVTSTHTTLNKNLQTIKYKEETISPEGKKKIECKTQNNIVDKEFDFNITPNYKSDIEVLSCTDGSERTSFFELKQSKREGYAILVTTATFKNEKANIDGVSTTKILINEKAKVIKITSEMDIKNKFSIKYNSTDILQR